MNDENDVPDVPNVPDVLDVLSEKDAMGEKTLSHETFVYRSSNV